MARPPALQLDKTELVLFDLEAKRPQIHNLRYDQISRIQCGRRRQFRLYHFVAEDAIEIQSRTRLEPFLLTRRRNKTDFDRFEGELEAFAKRNNITFGRSVPDT